jgi:hypothetical protein
VPFLQDMPLRAVKQRPFKFRSSLLTAMLTAGWVRETRSGGAGAALFDYGYEHFELHQFHGICDYRAYADRYTLTAKQITFVVVSSRQSGVVPTCFPAWSKFGDKSPSPGQSLDIHQTLYG